MYTSSFDHNQAIHTTDYNKPYTIVLNNSPRVKLLMS